MYSLPTNKTKRGFTFVEILIVIAVMVILAAIAFAAISNYTKRQSFEQTVQSVTLGIERAVRASRTGYGNVDHGVYVGTSTIEFFTGDTVTVGDPNNDIIELGTISVTSTLPTANTSIVFTRLTGRPDQAGTITFTDATVNASKTITIGATGLIE